MSDAGWPTVSVILPVRDMADTLPRALASIAAQTYPHIIEIIVVDDGSTDATADLLRRHHPAVRCLRVDHGRPGAARNDGVAIAGGDLVAFLDGDDEWLPGKIAAQVEVLRATPGLRMVLAQPIWVYPDGRRRVIRRREMPRVMVPSLGDWLHRRPRRWLGVAVYPSSWLMERSLFLETGGFSKRAVAGTDRELLCAIVARHTPVAVLCEPLYVYHVRPTSLSHSLPRQLRLATIDLFLSIIDECDPRRDAALAAGLPLDDYAAIYAGEYARQCARLVRLGASGRAREALGHAWANCPPTRWRWGLKALWGVVGAWDRLVGVWTRIWHGNCRR